MTEGLRRLEGTVIGADVADISSARAPRPAGRGAGRQVNITCRFIGILCALTVLGCDARGPTLPDKAVKDELNVELLDRVAHEGGTLVHYGSYFSDEKGQCEALDVRELKEILESPAPANRTLAANFLAGYCRSFSSEFTDQVLIQAKAAVTAREIQAYLNACRQISPGVFEDLNTYYQGLAEEDQERYAEYQLARKRFDAIYDQSLLPDRPRVPRP